VGQKYGIEVTKERERERERERAREREREGESESANNYELNTDSYLLVAA
jgi:hypothetical protein